MNVIPSFPSGSSACGVDEKIAVEDACRMEHTMSPESFTAIKNFYHSRTKTDPRKKDSPDPHEDPGCLFSIYFVSIS